MKLLRYILLALIFLPACLETDDAFIHEAIPDTSDPYWDWGSHRLLVYVNFGGGTLFYGDCGYPQKNITCIPQTGGAFPPHDSDEEYRSDVIELLRVLWSSYDVGFTTTRPSPTNHYVMAIVSPQTSFNDHRKENGKKTVGGVAHLDCGNKRLSDTAHVFSQYKNSPLNMAEIISHEVGHTIGLGHVLDEGSMMYGTGTKEDREFKDKCVQPSSGTCPSLAPEFCFDGLFINNHQELLQIVGPTLQ